MTDPYATGERPGDAAAAPPPQPGAPDSWGYGSASAPNPSRADYPGNDFVPYGHREQEAEAQATAAAANLAHAADSAPAAAPPPPPAPAPAPAVPSTPAEQAATPLPDEASSNLTPLWVGIVIALVIAIVMLSR